MLSSELRSSVYGIPSIHLKRCKIVSIKRPISSAGKSSSNCLSGVFSCGDSSKYLYNIMTTSPRRSLFNRSLGSVVNDANSSRKACFFSSEIWSKISCISSGRISQTSPDTSKSLNASRKADFCFSESTIERSLLKELKTLLRAILFHLHRYRCYHHLYL